MFREVEGDSIGESRKDTAWKTGWQKVKYSRGVISHLPESSF